MAAPDRPRWQQFDRTALSPSHIEELRRVVADPEQSPRLRFDALRALARLAKPSEHEVLQTTVAALFDPVPQIRQLAEAALLGWNNRAIPRLLQFLREQPAEDTDRRVRLVLFIGEFGPAAAVAAPYLRSLAAEPTVGDAVRLVLPKLQIGMGQFIPWMGSVVQDWTIVTILVFALVWLVLEFAGPINLANWLPGKKGELGAPGGVPRSLVFGLGLAGVLAIQAARWLMRYETPNRPMPRERAFNPLTLTVVFIFAIIVLAIVFARLQAVAGR